MTYETEHVPTTGMCAMLSGVSKIRCGMHIITPAIVSHDKAMP